MKDEILSHLHDVRNKLLLAAAAVALGAFFAPRPAEASIPRNIAHLQRTPPPAVPAPVGDFRPVEFRRVVVEVDGILYEVICRNDPVNSTDPLGLEAYIVYRQFQDKDKRDKYPSQGHVFLAFDEKGISDVQRWRDMVKELGRYTPAGPQSAFRPESERSEDAPDKDAETFSFHPWNVYSEGEAGEYNVLGIFVSGSSYIGYGDEADRAAFAGSAGALKAKVFPLGLTEEQQVELYEKAIASRNVNNAAPTSWDMGSYMVGKRNCGSWTVWLTEQVKGVKYPKGMKKYNRAPVLPRVSVGGATVFPGVSFGGVGMGGWADHTVMLPANVVIGTAGVAWQGTQCTGYGLKRGGEAALDAGRSVVNGAEVLPAEGGLVGWRF